MRALFAKHQIEIVILDDAKAIHELNRVLAPMGVAILMVPILLGMPQTDEAPSVTDVNECWWRFSQDDHTRMYGRSDFLKHLHAGSFQAESFDATRFGHEGFQQCGITEQSVLYVGHY